MRAYVDKIEGGKAELRLGEDEAIALVLPVSELPSGVREGQVLTMTFKRDEAAERSQADENDALREKLLRRSQDEPF